MIDFGEIKRGLAGMNASASHTASGQDRPQVDEIFAPEHHAGALDPNATIVLGARGAGKSFWAGVLADDQLRAAAADAYPNLGLSQIVARIGYSGLSGDGSVSRSTIEALAPEGSPPARLHLLWRCVLIRAMQAAINPSSPPQTINSLMDIYVDSERFEMDAATLDSAAVASGRKVIVLFDALDSLAVDWQRLRDLLDSLLEVSWEIRGYQAVRCKLFLRPDQTRDIGLRFVELPKLLAGATKLDWSAQDLFGMLYVRLGNLGAPADEHFAKLLSEEGFSRPPSSLKRLRSWPPATDRVVQSRIFTRLAGPFMGRSNKKGRTFEWVYKHLLDGNGEATPRSFLTMMVEAARASPDVGTQALTADGIRAGLRAASKSRVDQLEVEFPWVKRVLAPLARLHVPSGMKAIEERWAENQTIEAVQRRAQAKEFLPPFERRGDLAPEGALIEALVRIGVLTVRNDGRYDMPDLFRVAARLLKRGGVAPN